MTAILPATWANMGYGRLFHPEPPLVQSLRTAMELTKLYEFHRDSSGHWARLRTSVRSKGVFIHSGSITAANVGHADALAALDTFWWQSERRLPEIPYNKASIESQIAKSRGYRKLLWIRHLLSCTRYSQYVRLLREVAAPAFFDAYPHGQIHIIRVSEDLSLALQTIDLLGIMRVYSIPEVRQSRRRSVTAGQSRHLGSAVLQAVLSAFHPNLYGLVVERFSFLLVFQCHPSMKLREGSSMPVLRDALRGKRLLEPNLIRASDPSSRIGSGTFGATRLRHVTRWRKETIHELVEWAVKRIDALYMSLLDPSLYLAADDSIDFIKQRQFYLTIDRIMSETVTVNTEQDTFLRKQLFFDVLDKYATLSGRKVDFKHRERTYLRLLKETHFHGRLQPLMGHMPNPFQAYLVKAAEEIYQQTMAQAIDGVWSRQRLDKARRLIQLKKFEKSSGEYIDSAPRISFEDFTAELIHGIRNSLHGYRMMGDTYERLLVSHSCEISNLLPDLATIFLFVLLSDPDEFVRHTWSKDITR